MTVESSALPGSPPLTVVDPPLRGPDPRDERWWRGAVFYQVYPRSWADSTGSGDGDLAGITARLEHLVTLGVDGVWVSPFYRSPQEDAGYDVADHRDVDPMYGTLQDAEELLARAHALGLRVITDVIPNHVSREHPWFRAALAAGPGSPERSRFVFRDGRGPAGEDPPNNWPSEFGGPAWTRVVEPDGTPGQWYLHLFDHSQPDLNWDHPDVAADLERTLRFWLDLGVDGFRVDAAQSLAKRPGLPDVTPHPATDGPPPTSHTPYKDQDAVHAVYRGWRALVERYDPPRMLCAEAWVTPVERAILYVRPDEMHQAFNVDFMDAGWDAARITSAVVGATSANASVGAAPTWVLSNHDTVRHASRLGMPPGTPNLNGRGIGPGDPQPDRALGLRRARAAALLMLALPGSSYLYQGEELGLPESTEMPDAARRDPTFRRSGGSIRGRDGCRVPIPWAKEAPSFGFGPGADPWLPQPEDFGDLAVDQQLGVGGSTLELYRSALRLRRERRLGSGGLALVRGYPDDVVALVVTDDSGAGTLVVCNLGSQPVSLPAGATVLLSSEEAEGPGLPADATVWAAWPPAS
jgi:alpha-glucosidase